MADELRYQDADHTYWLRLDGRKDFDRIPGFTEVLRSAGVIKTQFMTPAGRVRGSNTHLALPMLIDGDLDPASVHESYAGYLKGFERFVDETRFERISSERPGYYIIQRDPLIAFGTKSDFVGYFGKPSMLNPSAGLEVKTGKPSKWHELQTAAQALTDYLIVRRHALYLSPDGTYKLSPPHSKTTDAEEFIQHVIKWWELNREN